MVKIQRQHLLSFRCRWFVTNRSECTAGASQNSIFFRHFCFSVKLQCNYNAPERFAKSCLVFSAPALMHFSSSSVGTISRSHIYPTLQQIWMCINGHTNLEDRYFTVGRSILSLWIVMLFFLTPVRCQVWPLNQFFSISFFVKKIIDLPEEQINDHGPRMGDTFLFCSS